MSDKVAREFMDATFSAPRMVLSGAGVDHDTLVNLAEKHFSGLPTSTVASDAVQVREVSTRCVVLCCVVLCCVVFVPLRHDVSAVLLRPSPRSF